MTTTHSLTIENLTLGYGNRNVIEKLAVSYTHLTLPTIYSV